MTGTPCEPGPDRLPARSHSVALKQVKAARRVFVRLARCPSFHCISLIVAAPFAGCGDNQFCLDGRSPSRSVSPRFAASFRTGKRNAAEAEYDRSAALVSHRALKLPSQEFVCTQCAKVHAISRRPNRFRLAGCEPIRRQ